MDEVFCRVKNAQISLSALQQSILEPGSARSPRLSLILIDQITITLTSALIAFSQLEALVALIPQGNDLLIVSPKIWNTIGWDEEVVGEIV